jgi:hypothetical protein
MGTCLLKLLDGTLVDTTALVDQVTSGGRLAGIDVADNDDVDVNLVVLAHDVGIERCLSGLESVLFVEFQSQKRRHTGRGRDLLVETEFGLTYRLPDKIALESRYSDEEAKEKEKQNCWRGVRNLLTLEGRASGGVGQKIL